jgi:hypothetical protein
MTNLRILTTSIFLWNIAIGQVAKDQVVQLTANINNGKIELKWPSESYNGNYSIYKKSDYTVDDWGTIPIAVLPGGINNYVDNSSEVGERYEYLVVKARGTTTDALGYLSAGNFAIEQTEYGAVILLVDSNYLIPLSNEIITFKKDMVDEGWRVHLSYAGRNENVAVVKNRIKSLVDNDSRIKLLVLLGNIPVPYSGYYSSNGHAPPPDGHVEGSGNHTGAWPADVYYGILNDVFTDNDVNCTTGAQQRNHNVPGDGKFDQTKLPAIANLEVGRIDLTKLSAFTKNDTDLTRDYLNRNHAWRTGNWKVVERALIDNNFTSLNLASTGYANFSAILGWDSIFDNRDYITSQKNGSYLLSYGCGAGSYTSCSGIGTTNSFVTDSFENVFTILAGSYFGDWDVANNFLRAPLASSSLACFWGGLPKWYIHHMGIGERIGKGTKITQNNTGFYFTGNFNNSQNSMHIALMGDPTLRIRNLPTVSILNATSSNNLVYMNWGKVDTFEYAVYRFDTINRTFTRLNRIPIKDTFYVDSFNFSTGQYVYAVKCIKLEVTGSGSYYNTGGAAYASLYHINSLKENSIQANIFKVFPNPSSGRLNISIQADVNLPTDELLIELFDIHGKKLESVSTVLPNRNYELDYTKYPNGIYLLDISLSGQTICRNKVIITK